MIYSMLWRDFDLRNLVFSVLRFYLVVRSPSQRDLGLIATRVLKGQLINLRGVLGAEATVGDLNSALIAVSKWKAGSRISGGLIYIYAWSIENSW